jgi:hypothetical protein
VDDREFFIELERIKAERKSPAWVWVGNLVWPGLGNLIVGDKGGWTAGFVTWVVILIVVSSVGLLLPLIPLWYLVVSIAGHRFVNRQYAQSLDELRRRYEGSGDQPSA